MLSVVIPSRSDPHITKTVDGIFAAARGDIQCTVVLDGGSWPEGWAQTVERHSPRLLTIRHGASRGMRGSINAGVDAAHDAEFILKSDSHCLFSDGFDVALTSVCGDREVLVPRRYRLDCSTWSVIDDGRAPVDYEYLSFPELKGKVWNERAKERATIICDETPLTQGSCWLMKRSYFEFLELLDEEHYGTFWKEMLEIAMKAYLSGGCIKTLKNCWYAHPHQNRTYKLESGEQVKAHEFSKKWLTGSAGWKKQTLPFQSFLDRFGGMPSWPPGWNAMLVDHQQESLAIGTGVV